MKRHLTYLFPDRVTRGHTPGGVRIGDHDRIVVAQHSALPGHARHNRLAPAGKSSEEVRLDKASEDLYIARHQLAVQPDFVPAGGDAEMHLCGLDRRHCFARCAGKQRSPLAFV